jgi:hypothetical protein
MDVAVFMVGAHSIHMLFITHLIYLGCDIRQESNLCKMTISLQIHFIVQACISRLYSIQCLTPRFAHLEEEEEEEEEEEGEQQQQQ